MGNDRAAASDPEFHAGDDLDVDLVRAAFEVILRPSFEPDELSGIEALIDPASGLPLHEIIVAADDGEPIGMAVFDSSPGAPALLSYLAVRPGLRSRGLGSALLGRVTDHWRREGVDLAVAEIHDPRCHAEDDDEHPAARLAFYARHGAEVLGPWMQPANSGGNRVAGMLLIALHRSGEAADSADALGAALRPWVEQYYLLEEGAVPDDAAYRSLVASYEGPVEALPLDDFERVPLA